MRIDDWKIRVQNRLLDQSEPVIMFAHNQCLTGRFALSR
jgi:hypothetical protein